MSWLFLFKPLFNRKKYFSRLYSFQLILRNLSSCFFFSSVQRYSVCPQIFSTIILRLFPIFLQTFSHPSISLRKNFHDFSHIWFPPFISSLPSLSRLQIYLILWFLKGKKHPLLRDLSSYGFSKIGYDSSSYYFRLFSDEICPAYYIFITWSTKNSFIH